MKLNYQPYKPLPRDWVGTFTPVLKPAEDIEVLDRAVVEATRLLAYPEEREFRNALADQQNDNTLLLILADWMQEHDFVLNETAIRQAARKPIPLYTHFPKLLPTKVERTKRKNS